MAQPSRGSHLGARISASIAALVLLLGLIYVGAHLAHIHGEYGEWAWSPSPAPPIVHFDNAEFLRADHPTLPVPGGLAPVAKTPGGGSIYANLAATPVDVIVVHTGSKSVVDERQGSTY